MEEHIISFFGRDLRDKHTHYEVYPYVGPFQTTVIIPGYITADFKQRYAGSIGEYTLTVRLEFLRQSELVEECRDPFKRSDHLRATIRDLEGVLVEKI